MIVLQALAAGFLFVLITLLVAAVDFAVRDLLKRRAQKADYPSEFGDGES